MWAPDAGIQVRLKVEDHAERDQVGRDRGDDHGDGWLGDADLQLRQPGCGHCALNLANTYNKISVFPNFGKTGAQIGGASTYYFDDLAFGGGTPVSRLPITFD